jgi:hypothetical protein
MNATSGDLRLARPGVDTPPGGQVRPLRSGGESADTPLHETPFYQASGDEVRLFEHAWNNRLPLLIKGPTGCRQDAFRGAHGGPPRPALVYRGLP